MENANVVNVQILTHHNDGCRSNLKHEFKARGNGLSIVKYAQQDHRGACKNNAPRRARYYKNNASHDHQPNDWTAEQGNFPSMGFTVIRPVD